MARVITNVLRAGLVMRGVANWQRALGIEPAIKLNEDDLGGLLERLAMPLAPDVQGVDSQAASEPSGSEGVASF